MTTTLPAKIAGTALVVVPLAVYVLLDRSGSMAGSWAETLTSLNAYVGDLAKDSATSSARVTLATFDHHAGLRFEVLRRDAPVQGFHSLSAGEAEPRGTTPLFDAVGRMATLATEDKPARAVFVVITDGAENASREMTREGAKATFDRCREKGWQVVFLGADFDAMGQAASVGTAAAQTMRMHKGNYRGATASLAAQTSLYAGTGRSMSFTDGDGGTVLKDRNTRGEGWWDGKSPRSSADESYDDVLDRLAAHGAGYPGVRRRSA